MISTALLLALALQQAPVQPAAQTLTLDDAVRIAKENAPQLRAARASSDAASARALQSLSTILPQIFTSADLDRSTANSGLSTLPESWAMSNTLSLRASATQTVVDLPAFARYGAARASATAEASSSLAAELDAVLAARLAFYQARALKELVNVARESLENRQAHFRQIEAFVQQGIRPPIDLAQARTDRANAKAQLVNAANGYATARVRLNQAMGVIGPTDYEVVGEQFPAVEGEDRPLDPLLAEALAARPDVAAAESRILAGERSLSAAQGGYFPKLGVSAGASDVGPDSKSLTWNASIGATLSWQLFQGGLTRAQASEARAAVEGLKASRDLLVQQVRVDVDSARLDIHAAEALVDADREAVEAARERLRLAEARYSAGAGSALELSDAQLGQTDAEAKLVQAHYQRAQARARLQRALGRP